MIRSFHGENYELHWQGVSFLGKKILDVGADIGSTADYFMRKGASLVYAVEGEPMLYEELERNSEVQHGIVPILLFIDTPNDWEALIRNFAPDLVKVDCEGCERCLLILNDLVLSSVPEYIIEAHTEELFQSLLFKLSQNGYDVSHYQFENAKVMIAQSISKYRIALSYA